MVGPTRREVELELLCLFSSAAFRERELCRERERDGERELLAMALSSPTGELASELGHACALGFRLSLLPRLPGGGCLSLFLPLQPKRKNLSLVLLS